MRKEKAGFEKNNVCSGDLLILKSNEEVLNCDVLRLSVSVTTSGISDNCIYIGQVDVSKEQKLNQLKFHIISMKYFQDQDIAIECIRVRDKLNNQFFGKIFRDP